MGMKKHKTCIYPKSVLFIITNAQRRKTHERYRSVARIITHGKEADRSKTHMSNRLPWVTLKHTHTHRCEITLIQKRRPTNDNH